MASSRLENFCLSTAVSWLRVGGLRWTGRKTAAESRRRNNRVVLAGGGVEGRTAMAAMPLDQFLKLNLFTFLRGFFAHLLAMLLCLRSGGLCSLAISSSSSSP